MGTIVHKTVGGALSRVEWKSLTHEDSQGNTLSLARSATLIAAANDASAASKAGADTVSSGAVDDIDIQAVIDALP